MATSFIAGRYYKNEHREVVILVKSRTRCFVNYEEHWITNGFDKNTYQEGKVKVRVNEDGNEFVLIDGFSKYSSIDEYVKYVKEEEIKETLEDSDLPLPSPDNDATVNNVKEEEVKDLVLPLTKSLTFKEVSYYAQDNGYELEPLLGMFRLIKNNVIKTFPGLKSCKDFITEEKEEDKVRVKELVEGKKITLEDSDLPLPTNAIATVGKVTEVKILTKMVAVNPDVHHEVGLIHDAIFGWQLVGADSQLLREPLNEGGTQPTLKFKTREGATNFAVKLMAKVKELVEGKTKPFEVIKEGRLLNSPFSSLPLPTKPTDNNAIATVNNLEEEKEEDNMALTKESYEAVKILVKYDFKDKNLTQFEVMALNSLKKYIQNGVEPKLLKTFAEVLIKKLTPEEKRELRDKALERSQIRRR